MQLVFCDTSALIGLGSKSDALHHRSVAIYRQLREENARFVTTGAVLLEVGNAFSHCPNRNIALQLIHSIFQSARWEVIFQDYVLMKRGLALFSERQDKNRASPIASVWL
uniref:Predicted nucleic acid-binding protein, contains PIN domain n=1 Tax=Candidatus Kentrum sp. DK TaxID=2126562 RepID=A0A450TAB6_9GAMM|nr:MAG: Predicted nucleic acid-binding protein, contains PIN domain [Candidatus Kentron sp. DK]